MPKLMLNMNFVWGTSLLRSLIFQVSAVSRELPPETWLGEKQFRTTDNTRDPKAEQYPNAACRPHVPRSFLHVGAIEQEDHGCGLLLGSREYSRTSHLSQSPRTPCLLKDKGTRKYKLSFWDNLAGQHSCGLPNVIKQSFACPGHWSLFFIPSLGESNIFRCRQASACTHVLTPLLAHVSWLWWETLPVRNHWGT